MEKIIEEKISSPQLNRWNSVNAPTHFHSDIELIYVISGEITGVCNGKQRILTPNTFFLVMPNQVHGYNWIESGIEYICCLIKPSMLNINEAEFANFEPAEPLLHNNDDIAPHLLQLALDEYNGDNDPFVTIPLLSALFSKLLSAYEMVKSVKHNTRLDAILKFCKENFKEEISCTEAAKRLGISQSYLSHIIRENLQTTYKNYINQLRILEAVSLIDSGANITDVSLECGFTTIRTFNRAFKRLSGLSPHEYLTNKRQK